MICWCLPSFVLIISSVVSTNSGVNAGICVLAHCTLAHCNSSGSLLVFLILDAGGAAWSTSGLFPAIKSRLPSQSYTFPCHLVSVRNSQEVLQIFWELRPRNRALNLFSLGCLPLSCSACVPSVVLGGKLHLPVLVSLFAFGGDKGWEIHICNWWVQLSRLFSYLLCVCVVGFFPFYYFAWNLKSSSECRVALALVLRSGFRFGWEPSCWKVLVEAFFVLLLIIISFPLARDR